MQTGLIGHLPAITVVVAFLLTALLAATAVIARHRWVILRVPARLESVRPLADTLDECVRQAQFDDQAAFHCRLALDEACANIIKHSYDNDPQGEIEARIRINPGMCEIRLTDFGKPYDPAHVVPPTVGMPVEDITPGGLGLHLMRTVMDEVRYTAGPNGNCLVLVKRRQAHQS